MMLLLIFGGMVLALGCVLLGWRSDKRNEKTDRRRFPR
jgi:hypothetical protein